MTEINSSEFFSQDNSQNSTINPKQTIECKVYKKRWLILLLFSLYTISSFLQWVLYSVIANVIHDYYQVSYTAAQWTSLIGIVVYLAFSTPGLYMLDKLGLRWCTIIGIVGTCIGSWIKVGSVDPSRFWLLVFGQGVVGVFRVLILPVPQKLASTWFGKNEISQACAIAVIATKVSAVLGFLLGPFLVDGKSRQEVEDGLQLLAYIVAIVPTILLPLIIILFDEAPPTPPSIAQLNVQNHSINMSNYKQTLKNLFCNRSFVIFLIIFGITSGLEHPIGIVLNQIILKYHPDAAKEVGIVGVIITLFGLIGTYVFGFLIDKLKRFKLITLTIFISNGFTLILFLSTLSVHMYFIFAISAIMGFFAVGLNTIGFIISAQLSYPEPEGTTGGLLMAIAQGFGLVFAHLYTFLYTDTSELVSGLVISSILVVTTALFMFVKFDMRKYNVEKSQV